MTTLETWVLRLCNSGGLEKNVENILEQIIRADIPQNHTISVTLCIVNKVVAENQHLPTSNSQSCKMVLFVLDPCHIY